MHPIRKAGRLDNGSGEVEGDAILGPGGHREEAAGEAAGDPEAASDVQLGIQVRAADDGLSTGETPGQRDSCQ